jgi:hypothetical protein
MVLASIGLSWFAVKMQKARRQREAIAAIEAAGGRVLYDYEIDASRHRIPNAQPKGPAWLRRLLGDDFLSEVAYVCINHKAGLEHLKGLPQVREAHLDCDWLTDGYLECLKGLTRLEELSLRSSKVTDAGLEHLEGLTSLKVLDLDDTSITDAGLEHIKALTQLESVSLGRRITDDGLDRLKQLSKLRYIFLSNSEVTFQGERMLREARPDCYILNVHFSDSHYCDSPQ